MSTTEPFTTQVLETWSPTAFTHAIRIARPPGVSFGASQATRVMLGTDLSRPMTIASGPARPHLDFAVQRSESDFKRAFAALRPGDTVRITPPRGHFLLDRARPAVMIASGIGITPFRSMLEALSDEDARLQGVLVHHTLSRFDVPFAPEIDALAEAAGIRVIRGIGPVDTSRVRSFIGEALFYIAGPVEDVKHMRTELESLGVAKEALLLEAFRYAGDLSTPPPRSLPDWDVLYRTHPGEEMPWHYPDLDPDVAGALDTQRIERGRALDVGTGTGTQAIALAARGFDVTGTDISPAAAAAAAQRAAQRNARARFLADDVLSSRLVDRFDLILDRGCFHVLAPERRPDYVRAMADRLAPAGHLFLKCFADDEPEGGGPHRFSPDDIRTLFAPTFEVVDITRTVYQGTLDRAPRALFCVLRPR